MTPEAMDQLAISIEPIVMQISPYMDKVQSMEKYSHIGKLENMIEKKKEIQKLARLNSLQYEKVQNLGKIPFSTQSSILYFSRRKYRHSSGSLQRNHRQLITWLRCFGSAALRTWRSKPLNVHFKCPCCQILIVPFFKNRNYEWNFSMSPDNNLKCKYVVDLEKSCLLNNFEKRGWIPVRAQLEIIQVDFCNL